MISDEHSGADVSDAARARRPASPPSLPDHLDALWQALTGFASAQSAHAALVLQAAGARLALVVVLTLVAAMIAMTAWLLILGFTLYHLALYVGWHLAVVAGVAANVALAATLLRAARIEIGRMRHYWTLPGFEPVGRKTGVGTVAPPVTAP